MDCLRCIARENMPQVDVVDYVALEEFLWAEYKIACTDSHIPTGALHHKQCPDHMNLIEGKIQDDKPLLVSSDLFILDGNHRHCGAQAQGVPRCHCVVVGAPFDEAVQAILHYAKTYREGVSQ